MQHKKKNKELKLRNVKKKELKNNLLFITLIIKKIKKNNLLNYFPIKWKIKTIIWFIISTIRKEGKQLTDYISCKFPISHPRNRNYTAVTYRKFL